MSESIDERAGGEVGVDDYLYGSETIVEGAGKEILWLDDDVTFEVGVAVMPVANPENASFGRVVELVVDAREHLVAVAVDESALVVIEIDLAVVAVELVDKAIAVGCDDGAVGTLEAEERAVGGGLDAVNEDQLAAARLVVNIFHLLGLNAGGQ